MPQSLLQTAAKRGWTIGGEFAIAELPLAVELTETIISRSVTEPEAFRQLGAKQRRCGDEKVR